MLDSVPQWASTWLTPIWLLGAGALAGLVVVVLLWLVLAGVSFLLGRAISPLVSKEWMESIQYPFLRNLVAIATGRVSVSAKLFTGGPMAPLFVLALILAVFGVVGILAVRRPSTLLESLARLPETGERTYEFDVPPSESDESVELAEREPERIEIRFNRAELNELRIRSDLNVDISAYDRLLTDTVPRFEIDGGEEFIWRKSTGGNHFPQEEIDSLYVWSDSDLPTHISITTHIQPRYPQVWAIPATAFVVVVVFSLWGLQQLLFPKIGAVALATAKSQMAQPLFLICILVSGAFLLPLFLVLPYNTFGEDIKMMKDSGLTTIMVFTLIPCLWASANSIAEEIEGRTALSVLSKPIGRRQFIIGKFVGIVWVAVVMFCILGTVFLVTLSYKPLYDARETANLDPTWQICFDEVAQTSPGLLLGLFETIVLVAISVAVSTRLPMLANVLICFAVYALGHLTPMIVKSSIGEFAPVVFVAQLIATVFPVLEHFNITPAIAGGVYVPLDYLGWSLLYCLLYSSVAILLALTLFEDRDLA